MKDFSAILLLELANFNAVFHVKHYRTCYALCFTWNIVALVSYSCFTWNIVTLVSHFCFTWNTIALVSHFCFTWNIVVLVSHFCFTWNIVALISHICFTWNIVVLVSHFCFTWNVVVLVSQSCFTWNTVALVTHFVSRETKTPLPQRRRGGEWFRVVWGHWWGRRFRCLGWPSWCRSERCRDAHCMDQILQK